MNMKYLLFLTLSGYSSHTQAQTRTAMIRIDVQRYGHKQPFAVKYWCLGNEVDGAPWIMRHKDADDYCKIAIEAAKAMKATDNNIRFIANGSSLYDSTGSWLEWNRKIIGSFTGIADYLSSIK
jgi:alpha-N-arabinofuranosidase